MRALLATAVLLVASGCVTDEPEGAGPRAVDDPAPSVQAADAPPLPDDFTAEHRFDMSGIQAGGIAVRHEFALAVPATLHLVFTADVPEGVVELEVQDADGAVFSDLVPAPVDGARRAIALEPGSYTVSAQTYGFGGAKSFSLSGSFTAT